MAPTQPAGHLVMDLPLLTATPTALPASRSQPPEPAIVVLWARHPDEVLAAQRLRYRVFVEEMGARLSPLAGTPVGHDIDAFDAHCEHLLVRTPGTQDSPGRVVGTYRVLIQPHVIMYQFAAGRCTVQGR